MLDWNEGGHNVAVAGTFTGWRKRVKLRKTYFRSLICLRQERGIFDDSTSSARDTSISFLGGWGMAYI
jgi:hypothetical protein